MITIINCKSTLEANGIMLEQIGAGDKFYQKILQKAPDIQWDYTFETDKLKVWTTNQTLLSKLSQLGEVVANDSTMG